MISTVVSEIVSDFQGLNVEDCTRTVLYSYKTIGFYWEVIYLLNHICKNSAGNFRMKYQGNEIWIWLVIDHVWSWKQAREIRYLPCSLCKTSKQYWEGLRIRCCLSLCVFGAKQFGLVCLLLVSCVCFFSKDFKPFKHLQLPNLCWLAHQVMVY